MKLCNDTITVFNAHWDEDVGDDVYYPHEIVGVSWYATQAETVDPKGGLVMANKAIVRIPAEVASGYVDPIAWKDAQDLTGKWTLQGGTVIIKGTIPEPGPDSEPEPEPEPEPEQGEETETEETTQETQSATSSAVVWTPALLKQTYPDCMTVLGVTDNRRAPSAPHFKVVGS